MKIFCIRSVCSKDIVKYNCLQSFFFYSAGVCWELPGCRCFEKRHPVPQVFVTIQPAFQLDRWSGLWRQTAIFPSMVIHKMSNRIFTSLKYCSEVFKFSFSCPIQLSQSIFNNLSSRTIQNLRIVVLFIFYEAVISSPCPDLWGWGEYQKCR